MSQFSQQVIDLVDAAERLKKVADLSYTKGEYVRSIATYDLIIETLKPLRGSSVGEFIAIKVLANQTNAYLKKDDFSSAIASSNLALTIPSVHMMVKILHRKSIALAGTGQFDESLENVDHAISLGETASTGSLDELRESLIKSISARKMTPIPPRPACFSPDRIKETIMTMFGCKGEPTVVLPLLTE
jgi:tetratricopeptide (TPR) repeat protein